MKKIYHNSLCNILKWDSEFFNCNIAQINNNYLRDSDCNSIFKWCLKHKVDCLYYLSSQYDRVSLINAVNNGFNLVDIRITLENNLDNFRTFNWECFNINEASIIDLKYLRNIAKESHHDSRFYYDGHFNISKCSLFYQKWIENSIKSSDIVVFTARDIKIPIGYITCKITKGNIGQIGLFAVSDKYRGKGIGKSLINRSLQWFKDNKCNKAIVVTQGRNIIGQKVYQKCNFFTEDIKIWFHKWFTYEKI